jgi:hypothetical protein
MSKARTPFVLVPGCVAGALGLALAFPSLRQEAWELAAPAPAVALAPAAQERAGELDCAECHARETEEWARTAHAIAWVDRFYIDELEGRPRAELCHGCHIPQPILAGDPAAAPRARVEATEALHFGISCRSCHEGPDGVLLGPTGAPTDAHPTRASEHMRAPGSNELCAACHSTNIGPVVGIAKDFEKAGLAGQGKSCVGCHLAVQDANASPAGAGTPAEAATGRTRRSHELQTPRDPSFLRRAFEPTARVEGGRTLVEIANRAGHRVPGLKGREIRFHAEVRAADGKVLASAEKTLSVRTYLPVQGTQTIQLDAAGAEVHLVGEHQDPRAESPVRFLELTLQPTGR